MLLRLHTRSSPSRCPDAIWQLAWSFKRWGNMSLGFGYQENSASLDSLQGLQSLHQTSSLSLGTVSLWINFYKCLHARAVGKSSKAKWVLCTSQFYPKEPQRWRRPKRHICLKTHSFNPIWQSEGFVWGWQYQAGCSQSCRPCRCFQLNVIIKLAAQHG